MKRIRAEQQKIANENAIKAEEERKVKQKIEKERKRVKSPEEERWDKLGGTGKKLGSVGAGNGNATKIREEQQKIANENAIKAEEERKIREDAEKKKKREQKKIVKSPEEERWERIGGTGNKLGDAEDADDAKKTR